ncbi:hypothetical protein Kpol_534p33 [Vanderwaltozyma polyspora DSM 70294]|uniref:Amino acid permease/ SLC12A domain-containing protein n=1 Tax=Vanderwaltozyma polyspora (strain ATCC 22028 / DSM 70294 / BCRC 21397 / CBS 2163 / NBRC 10782 / NRRL Y-8283 / UCD 57-17) TaxID=436907 RepID=A7TJL0_VANPO|nr:uncharacterized protein Kpol_534p33 [Vanderwaltozyma polyspora DSM 70294]EDO17553.1 hypothetical protein Kpol_534p33 [Vanderwaltozyma polyspora DSM 70294]
MSSKFYYLKGSHKPSAVSSEDESSMLMYGGRGGSQVSTYFNYEATPRGQKISSKYDPDNPNKHKLGTYDGVFVPTALNVLSILMFLRFGFILGQLGILCTLGLLLLSYLINLLTTLSISAISTNGTVRGGGAYYMISRCLGAEFGGSIGLVFFLGQVFNSGMNAVGIIEPILYNFGLSTNPDVETALIGLLPVGRWYEFCYASTILFLCLLVALVGSQTVSRAGNFLFFVLVLSIASIPVSLFFKQPFNTNIQYTGPSWKTLKGNLFPHLTQGAAGSLLKGKETFNDLFGVFFPATAGIFAGAGMSSELRKPSKSIPKGTLWGLLFTFICYSIVVLAMGCSIPRKTLYRDVQVIQSVSAVQWLIFLGELSTSLFSIIVGMVGAAYVLDAISKDNVLPGLSFFSKKPIYSLCFTWFLAQLCLFSNVNKIATLITMTFLMTFVVMNLACFLLKISSAPNFRPSFKYFDKYTAFFGTVISTTAMFIVDGMSASAVILAMIVLFLFIHYYCPPKSWGDVSQGLIYHQVRKYLLRLRQDNIKYWRPQILLFVDNPRTSWNLIRFCNHLKKGGLYILGHVTVIDELQGQFNEVRKQQRAWMKIRDLSNIKAFVQIGTGPTLPWGVRNVFLGSGLGGMKPNITIIGFFDLYSYYHGAQLENSPKVRHISGSRINDPLPTDECKNEEKIKVQQWVEIIEDLSLMKSNIAVAHDFKKLPLPDKGATVKEKKYIDLYPIQMSAEMIIKDKQESMLTTNFDTYTLILQLGAILVTVPEWKNTHTLRIILFVENEQDRSNESQRMQNLLEVLRIDADVLVVSLDQFRIYKTIIKGDPIMFDYVSSMLQEDEWWKDLSMARNSLRPRRRFSTSNAIAIHSEVVKPKKYNTSKLQKLGVSLKMTPKMPQDINNSAFAFGGSEDEGDETDVRSIQESNTSLISIEQRLNYETSRRKPNINNKRLQSTKLPYRIASTSSLQPVFSSNTLPKTKVIEDGTGEQPTIVPIDEQEHIDNQLSLTRSISPKQTDGTDFSPSLSHDSLIQDMNKLVFNNVPSIAQYLILNDVMTQLSSSSDLIFSTLPLPPLGTHKDPEASLQYVRNLDIWQEGLPPTMLINSQTMTVTTAL